jgi:Protein phosphatase 2C
MRIEAFSEGKNLDDPEANEDQLLVLPGRGYAVIDGVTDITGRLFEGMRTGRLASRVVQRAAADFLTDPAETERRPEALIERASAALRAAYVRHCILEEVRAEPARRFGATLTIAADLGRTFRFIVIGDSGLRLNGSEVVVVDTGLDLVTATLRQEAYRLVEDAQGDLEARRRVGRACTFHGIAQMHPDMLPWLDDGRLVALYERSLAHCRARFPSAPVADIERLLDRGISGQTRFQNNTASPFSYATLDGFDIPMPLVRAFDRPRESVESIELFTDGYFKPAMTPDVAAWETAFAEVERIDPEKIDAYPSVKGTAGRMRTDDRTVVIVHL